MKGFLLAIVALVALAGVFGCRSPSQVPVSLEPLNDWLLYHGPSCRHYPFSCPPCPYHGAEQQGEAPSGAAQAADTASADR